MVPSPVLGLYLGRQFLIAVATVGALLAVVALLADFVELMRRAGSADDVGIAMAFGMAALRQPFLFQKVVPFALLFGAMLANHRLSRHHELVAMRAAGVSVWQILLPSIVLALLLGVAVVGLVNPLSSILVMRFEQLEARHLSGRSSLLAMSSSGLWLREGDGDRQTVIHAARADGQDVELGDAVFFLYEGQDHFVRRVDARRAVLDDGAWSLTDVLVTTPDGATQTLPTYRLPTTLTLESIQESFASPDTLSFWELPRFIDALEASGFSALRHRLHWHAVLAGPFLLAAMVLIAMASSLRLVRLGGTLWLVLGGVAIGFTLYFLSDVSLALGQSSAIPPVLAAWSPVGVATLAGLALLFHLEDG